SDVGSRTATPATWAMHSLLYVVPSQPHTGSKTSSHVFGRRVQCATVPQPVVKRQKYPSPHSRESAPPQSTGGEVPSRPPLASEEPPAPPLPVESPPVAVDAPLLAPPLAVPSVPSSTDPQPIPHDEALKSAAAKGP